MISLDFPWGNERPCSGATIITQEFAQLLTPLALFDVAERDANHYCCASHNTGTMKPVHVIGGGLAGSEAAWQLARAGVPVVLHEMRP